MKDGPLEPRYRVTHKNGQPASPGRRFFVLAMDTDPAALDATAACARFRDVGVAEVWDAAFACLETILAIRAA